MSISLTLFKKTVVSMLSATSSSACLLASLSKAAWSPVCNYDNQETNLCTNVDIMHPNTTTQAAAEHISYDCESNFLIFHVLAFVQENQATKLPYNKIQWDER